MGQYPKPLEVFSSGSILFLPSKPWPGMQALSQITNTLRWIIAPDCMEQKPLSFPKAVIHLWHDMSREQLGNLTLAFRCCVCSYFFRT